VRRCAEADGSGGIALVKSDDRGANDARFASLLREREEKRQLRREAALAVRTAGGQLPHGGQLDLLAAELRARDLEVSPRPFLDVELDGILHPDLREQQERAELATEAAAQFAHELSTLAEGEARDERETETSTPDPSPQEMRKRKKPKKKGGRHRPLGGFPIAPDRARTTEIFRNCSGAS
jgi:hypothetical protein